MSISERPSPDRRKQIELELAAIQVSRAGTPASKLPSCPGCGHDELWGWRTSESRYGFSCYLCTYELRFEDPRTETPQEAADAAFQKATEPIVAVALQMLSQNARGDMLRSFALSALVRRAGGQITLTADEMEQSHGPPVRITVDPIDHTKVTFTHEPCPDCAKDPDHTAGHA